MNDLIIMATLLRGPKHGYQLKHEAGLILGQGVLHDNLVYPLLHRFRENKWVSRKVAPGQRGQTRQQYSLTALGRKELIGKLSSFGERDARSSHAFRLRVGLFRILDSEARDRVLRAREQFLRLQTAAIKAIQAKLELDRYAAEVTSQALAEAAAELGWIARLRRLERSAKSSTTRPTR